MRARVVALTFALWVGCSASTDPGIRVSVVAAAAPSRGPYTSDLGYQVMLEHAWLSTATVEIFPCAEAGAWRFPTLIGVAHAHTVGSPTLLGIPTVESLVADPAARTPLGELKPPPDAYCRVKHTVKAADADAKQLPAEVDMIGKSFYASGTYARNGGAAASFTLSSTAAFEVDTTVSAVTLALSGRQSATIVLLKDNAHWFDGVDFETGTADAESRQILDNLRTSFGARIE